MSLGFAPGDLILFTRFISQVVNALKDEGGSKFEYQSAIQQCQDVLDLMSEIAQLDFSRVSQSLKSKIEERAESTKAIVTDFKALVARYEKSMGKTSERGATKSAARKIRWAFDAAKDLNKFQPRLSAQLHMIQIILQIGVWNFLGISSEADRQLMAPRSVQLLQNDRFTSHQLPYMWNRGLLNESQMQALATQITDLVYRRLLTLPAMAMVTPGRAFTLSDDRIAPTPTVHSSQLPLEISEPETEHANFSSSLARSHQEQNYVSTDSHRAVIPTQNERGSHPSLMAEINEHLHELNLGELSDTEMQDIEELAIPRLLLEGPSQSEQVPSATDDDTRTHDNIPHAKLRRAFLPRFKSATINPFPALGLAADIVHFVDTASKIATLASSVYRDINGAPFEILMFSSRVTHYSQLLTVVSGHIMGVGVDKGLQSLTDQLLSETHDALSAAKGILDRYQGRKYRSRLGSRFMGLSWIKYRNDMLLIIERMDALKPSLIIILQMLQMKAQNRAIQELV